MDWVAGSSRDMEQTRHKEFCYVKEIKRGTGKDERNQDWEGRLVGAKRQKLQQLTSHGFLMSLEERLACQHPPSDKGTEGREGAGVMGEEEESCPTAAFINMRTCSLRRYSETNRCRPLHINTHMAATQLPQFQT